MDRKTDFLLGIKEIDDQHGTLFDCILHIEEAVSREERWSAVHYSLVQLTDFARIHFSVEECLMRILGYPELESHVLEHRQFGRKLDELRDRSVKDDISDEMVNFLRSWLTGHILKSDQAYVRHFLKYAGGAAVKEPDP